MEINVFDEASVELTAKGAEIVTNYHMRKPVNYGEINPKKIVYKEGDIYTDNLYVIMDIFGRVLYKNCTPLFVNNSIKI